MYINGYGTWLEGDNNVAKGYKSIKEALENFKGKENKEGYISLGVGKDKKGNYWFSIDDAYIFTNCTMNDLDNWEDWYLEEWIQKED